MPSQSIHPSSSSRHSTREGHASRTVTPGMGSGVAAPSITVNGRSASLAHHSTRRTGHQDNVGHHSTHKTGHHDNAARRSGATQSQSDFLDVPVTGSTHGQRSPHSRTNSESRSGTSGRSDGGSRSRSTAHPSLAMMALPPIREDASQSESQSRGGRSTVVPTGHSSLRGAMERSEMIPSRHQSTVRHGTLSPGAPSGSIVASGHRKVVLGSYGSGHVVHEYEHVRISYHAGDMEQRM